MTFEQAPGLQNFDFMETDEWAQDPNLNVTSAPEQLDLVTEASVQSSVPLTLTPAIIAPSCQYSEDSSFRFIDLTSADQMTFEQGGNGEFFASDTKEYAAYTPAEFCPSNAGCDFIFDSEMDQCPGPATVTLVRPQKLQIDISGNDPVTTRLMQDLYKEDPDTMGMKESNSKLTSAPQFRQPQPPTDTTMYLPNLTLFEPNSIKPEVQTPAFDLLSPTDSMDTGFTLASEDAASTVTVSPDRDAEIDRMASYIREVIEKRGAKPEDMSSKLKVHEVILVILLNGMHGGSKSRDLQRILAFCDESGRECSVECRNFKTLDTETMGLLWQKIKGNKKGNYDTFARAMRVRRERSEGFFEYLDAGKGKKKRIYRLGNKSMEEMARFKNTLRQVSKPQTCGY